MEVQKKMNYHKQQSGIHSDDESQNNNGNHKSDDRPAKRSHYYDWKLGNEKGKYGALPPKSNDDIQSQSSFLKLIRPMITDQINMAVQNYMESQIQDLVQKTMSNQLTMI